MTAPLQPPVMPEWIEAGSTKRINRIKFVGYVKPPKGEGFKP